MTSSNTKPKVKKSKSTRPDKSVCLIKGHTGIIETDSDFLESLTFQQCLALYLEILKEQKTHLIQESLEKPIYISGTLISEGLANSQVLLTQLYPWLHKQALTLTQTLSN